MKIWKSVQQCYTEINHTVFVFVFFVFLFSSNIGLQIWGKLYMDSRTDMIEWLFKMSNRESISGKSSEMDHSVYKSPEMDHFLKNIEKMPWHRIWYRCLQIVITIARCLLDLSCPISRDAFSWFAAFRVWKCRLIASKPFESLRSL